VVRKQIPCCFCIWNVNNNDAQLPRLLLFTAPWTYNRNYASELYIVVAKCIYSHDHLSIYLHLTIIISYISEALFFLGMLYASLISSLIKYLSQIGLRLYTIVYQVLDPLGEWIGEDENFTILLIRLSTMALTGLYIGIIKLSSSTPIIYYKLSEEDFTLEDVPFESRLKRGINIACCIVPLVLFRTGKIIQDQKDAGLLCVRCIHAVHWKWIYHIDIISFGLPRICHHSTAGSTMLFMWCDEKIEDKWNAF